MRNLVLQAERRRGVSCVSDESLVTESASSSSSLHAVGICQIISDHEDDSSRALLCSNGKLVRIDDNDKVQWECQLNQVVCAPADTQKQNDDWFSLTLADPGLVCMSRSGAIVTVSLETGVAELVGEFENGILAGAWSPDRELFLLVTLAEEEHDASIKNSVLLSMNSSWEVLAEVGVENMIVSTSESTKDHDHDHAVSISWRPDGTLVAVSSVDASDSMRKVRIYERDTLVMNAVGRTEDGGGKLVPNLQSTNIAWAGLGCSQVLAAVQRKGKKSQQVAFFEPNGLRHREFLLREDPSTVVIGLGWNVASDLLVVSLREVSCDKVQLWYRSNYHWYLKKELRYEGERIAFATFHDEQPYVLYVVLASNLQWREYGFRWDSSCTRLLSKSCVAFSVDGCELSSTPFHSALVPPPMFAAALSMPHPIAGIAFSYDESTKIIGVVSLSDGRLAVIGEGTLEKSDVIASYMKPELLALASWGELKNLDPTSFRNFVVVDTSPSKLRLLAIAPVSIDSSTHCERLVEISVTLNSNQGAEASVLGAVQLGGRVLTMVHWDDALGGALIELEDGELLEYEFSGETLGVLSPSEAEPLLEPCQWLAGLKNMAKLDDGRHSQRTRLVVGLSARSRLYCHDLLLADSASSFVVSTSQEFLSFATAGSQCQLRFISLKDLHNFDPLMGSDENYLLEGYEPRNIERGAQLVAVFPQQPKAILQMPRGNMEGICPRALVLRFAMHKITNGDYREAFLMMRRQKVDLNLVTDLDVGHFLDVGVAAFIEQVDAIDHLNLFIAGLQNWDITQARYIIPGWFRSQVEDDRVDLEPFDYATKVNQVCRKMRTLMLDAEESGNTLGGRPVSHGHFLLPVLSTFAKEDPPQLVEALNLIKKNALGRHSASSRKPPLFSETAQSSIQYLAFLANYDLLFETALGMYDYEIARAVARNSQMDPKVYLPLLKRYSALPLFFCRYEVDLRLKKYEAALRNLYKSGSECESFEGVDQTLLEQQDDSSLTGNSFEDCMRLIEQHGLHRLGLELFHTDEQQRLIMLSLSDRLMAEKRSSIALDVLLAAIPVDTERALRAARVSRDWRAFFSLVSQDEDPDKRSMVARDVAEELASSAEGQFNRRETLTEAARVLLDYGDDAFGAVDMLIRAETWSEAHRIGLLASRDELARKCVDAAVSYAETTIDDLEERRDTLCTSNTRYAEVLLIRKQAIADGEAEPDASNENDDNDTGSLFSAASNASNTSLSSNMSAGSMGSVGSVGSLSSVISVKSTNSFSLSGGEASFRHKSKYNKVGRNKKKKKKRGKGRTKVRPGSQQELQGLVDTMRSSCIDEQYCGIIADTITFLGRVRQLELARALYDCYTESTRTVTSAKEERIDTTRKEKIKEEKRARREGMDQHQVVVLGVEKEVDAMSWAPLPESLHEFFSFLPSL